MIVKTALSKTRKRLGSKYVWINKTTLGDNFLYFASAATQLKYMIYTLNNKRN